MDAGKIKQLAGNLSHAAWTGEGATIGGGKFSAAECKAAAIALDAAPAMLAALQQAVRWIDAGCDPSAKAVDAMRAAIAAATATPTGEAAPPVDSDGKRTDTWNLVPGAQPEEDDAALSTYRITETAVYLVKAEDEAHAERRFVCEVGIHADCFHASEGRTIEREEAEDD